MATKKATKKPAKKVAKAFPKGTAVTITDRLYGLVDAKTGRVIEENAPGTDPFPATPPRKVLQVFRSRYEAREAKPKVISVPADRVRLVRFDDIRGVVS